MKVFFAAFSFFTFSIFAEKASFRYKDKVFYLDDNNMTVCDRAGTVFRIKNMLRYDIIKSKLIALRSSQGLLVLDVCDLNDNSSWSVYGMKYQYSLHDNIIKICASGIGHVSFPIR